MATLISSIKSVEMVDVVDIGRRTRKFVVAAALLIAGVGCGQTVISSSTDTGPLTLRLGYFPNLTHAPALVGVNRGFFADALGKNVTLEAHTFNAGPEAVTALLSGSIDAAFIGPNSAINAFFQSHGEAIRVIAGSTSAGALFVVKDGIGSPAGLKGKKIADPQLGGTQDVALRWYLRQHGLRADTFGGGDVNVMPQDNATTLTSFKQGQIDGAWLPEPWASRLVVEAGADILVDERDLWPQGEFATTNLVVSTAFLQAHPQRVKALIEGLYNTIDYLSSNPVAAQQAANEAMAQITQKKLADKVVSAAWGHMRFTLDPLGATLKTSAEHARSLGLLPDVNLTGLYELMALNEVLAVHGKPAVAGL